MQTPLEQKAMDESKKQFAEELELVFQQIRDMMTNKGEDYDVLTPVWRRMPFASFSWAHEIVKKADRITSLLMKKGKPNNESLLDNVLDIAVYCILWLAYLRTEQRQEK
jgi:hypothetical protein